MGDSIETTTTAETTRSFGNRLRNLGHQVDEGLIDRDNVPSEKLAPATPNVDTAASAPAAQAEKKEEPSNAERAAAAGRNAEEVKSKPAETGKPADAAAAKEAAKPEGDKPAGDEEHKPGDSEFVKAKKDSQRFERNWKKLEEEKAALKTERETFQREREATTKATPQTQAPPAQGTSETKGTQAQAPVLKDDRGRSAADYEAAADSFADEGDHDLAKAARQRAGELRKAEAQQTQHRAAEEFRGSWFETMHKTLEHAEYAELKTEGSALRTAVDEILQKDPLFFQLPDGYARAAGLAKLRITANSVPQLEARISDLTKQLEAANARLAPVPSNPGKPPAAGTETPASGPRLRSLARRFDAARGAAA